MKLGLVQLLDAGLGFCVRPQADEPVALGPWGPGVGHDLGPDHPAVLGEGGLIERAPPRWWHLVDGAQQQGQQLRRSVLTPADG